MPGNGFPYSSHFGPLVGIYFHILQNYNKLFNYRYQIFRKFDNTFNFLKKEMQHFCR